ncbi:MAG TPA: hypothetical protein VG456_14830 [Candidatus Sulfopaludibacter sp.]|jgi:hypothetical protein|nr:hypothetical protein [Candidatus Sulfopaludibacter sp.]
MKKTGRITLTVVAAVGMVACSRRGPDPCESATFSEQACQDAVRSGGYYWNGSWYRVGYSHPYPYYYDGYSTYVRRGGSVATPAAGSYSSPAGSVVRGGFGSTGASHASGGGE